MHAGEAVGGPLNLKEGSADEVHTLNKTVKKPLVNVPFAELCPGGATPQEMMGEYG